jgi:hypothetical protein
VEVGKRLKGKGKRKLKMGKGERKEIPFAPYPVKGISAGKIKVMYSYNWVDNCIQKIQKYAPSIWLCRKSGRYLGT